MFEKTTTTMMKNIPNIIVHLSILDNAKGPKEHLRDDILAPLES